MTSRGGEGGRGRGEGVKLTTQKQMAFRVKLFKMVVLEVVVFD